MTTLIVGVCGNGPGAGKDTVANMLVQILGGNRCTFAAALRECVEIFTGLTPEETSTREGKEMYLPEWDMTVGQMLQRLGSDAVRDGLHPDAWVMPAMRRLPVGVPAVFSDVRFPNEAEAIRNRGGVLVRVVRDSLPMLRDGRDRKHSSETQLAPYLAEHPADFTIKNDVAMDMLCLRAGGVAQQLCDVDALPAVISATAQMISNHARAADPT